MKTVAASAASDLNAASSNSDLSIQRDMVNLPPKLKRKMLTWAREENAGTENEAKEVQASATRIVIRLPKRAAKQTPVKKVEKNKTNAKGKGKSRPSVAIEEKALDEPDLHSTESPPMPPPKKRKTEAGPAPKGGSEVEAATGRRRSQRIKAAAEASAQRRSR